MILVIVWIIYLFTITLLSFKNQGSKTPRRNLLFIAAALIGLVISLRSAQLTNSIGVFIVYALIITINYVITYYRAFFVYQDPADSTLTRGNSKFRVVYIIPVFNEQFFIDRCISSVLKSAQDSSDIAETAIIVVDDASTDNTLDRLRQFATHPSINVIELSNNVGKKGALVAGMCGGENWLQGYHHFASKHGRSLNPGRSDYRLLIESLEAVGCAPIVADYFFHTDSDSVISQSFIRNAIQALESNHQIGAVSGHCGVYIDPDTKPNFWTRLQVVWYAGQFVIRKAAESPYVYCVSGPGAAFRSESIVRHFPAWVCDNFLGRIYRGATDRKITLLVLQDGWQCVYSHSSRVWTVVPSSFQQARTQWTRWKQNYWRMSVPVAKFAYQLPLWSALLTYSRLLITAIAPGIVIFQFYLLSHGEIFLPFMYVAGVGGMGVIMGLATILKMTVDKKECTENFWLRPLMSIGSCLWGSMLTIRALLHLLNGKFSWRTKQLTCLAQSKFLRSNGLLIFEIWLILLLLVLFNTSILITSSR